MPQLDFYTILVQLTWFTISLFSSYLIVSFYIFQNLAKIKLMRKRILALKKIEVKPIDEKVIYNIAINCIL